MTGLLKEQLGFDGCDQFDGEAQPELVIQLVPEGTLLTEHIEYSGTPSKFYIKGLNALFIENRGHVVVASAEEAALYYGSLEFSNEEKSRQVAIYKAVPTIFDMQLDRPAAIPEIADQAISCSRASAQQRMLSSMLSSVLLVLRESCLMTLNESPLKKV
ncbi:hypothetical protein F4823DRAFT_567956 [Ustulina deusta]|nr:hypothetical protein F4823DRAFT_567956 [Ustulina deusta]